MATWFIRNIRHTSSQNHPPSNLPLLFLYPFCSTQFVGTSHQAKSTQNTKATSNLSITPPLTSLMSSHRLLVRGTYEGSCIKQTFYKHFRKKPSTLRQISHSGHIFYLFCFLSRLDTFSSNKWIFVCQPSKL